MRGDQQFMPPDNNSIVREGVSAGLIGATVIAVWFAVVDVLAAGLLSTPIMLGRSLATLFLDGREASSAAAFLLYTVFHYAMFVGIGLLLAWVINMAERTPSAMIGFIGLFIIFEVGWVGWTSVLAQGFGELTWLQVFIANIIGAAAMGYYMYRQHPGLPGRVRRTLVAAE
jgi:hypothetical protein